jgi:hypothetical protein
MTTTTAAIGLALVLLAWALCVMASRADRDIRRMRSNFHKADRIHKRAVYRQALEDRK